MTTSRTAALLLFCSLYSTTQWSTSSTATLLFCWLYSTTHGSCYITNTCLYHSSSHKACLYTGIISIQSMVR